LVRLRISGLCKRFADPVLQDLLHVCEYGKLEQLAQIEGFQ
jgi:hypothetical protein